MKNLNKIAIEKLQSQINPLQERIYYIQKRIIRKIKEMKEERVIQGEALEEMDKLIAEGVVFDAIITDPPYGTTACRWDTVIPFAPMWERLNKLIKPNGAIVLFGSEPFSSYLRISNIKNYKYDWVWEKERASNFICVKYQPLRYTENIIVFYSKMPIYNPQMFEGNKNHSVGKGKRPTALESILPNIQQVYQKNPDSILKYPKNIIKINRGTQQIHPTQKPVALMEYIIKTYTNEGELVLDFTAGSGTTLLACKNLNRSFIGIEKEPEYIEIIKGRLSPTSKNY